MDEVNMNDRRGGPAQIRLAGVRREASHRFFATNKPSCTKGFSRS